MADLVSVVIPAFNEEKVIGRLLLSLKNQKHRGIEILVIDDSSTDKTAQIAKKFTKEVYTRPHAERSVQRNFGARKAKGKYLFFLDADMRLSKNVVKECVDKIKEGESIGAIVIPEKSVASTFWEKVKAFERSFYNKEGDKITDAARFFSRAAFQKAGGYDENITGPEDWDLPERIEKLGYQIARTRSLIYHYERIKSLSSLLKKKYYYALKSHHYLTKHNISPASAKTIFFLRPVFYKNWRELLRRPVFSLALFFMLTAELFVGGLGFIVGRIKNA